MKIQKKIGCCTMHSHNCYHQYSEEFAQHDNAPKGTVLAMTASAQLLATDAKVVSFSTMHCRSCESRLVGVVARSWPIGRRPELALIDPNIPIYGAF